MHHTLFMHCGNNSFTFDYAVLSGNGTAAPHRSLGACGVDYCQGESGAKLSSTVTDHQRYN